MACVLTVAVVDERRRRRRPRRRHAALQASRRPHREDHARSLAGRRARGRATSCPSSRRCGTRGATRCIATSGRSRTSRTIRTSSTSCASPFEPDAALLLCSDGLTDLVESTAITRIVETFAGHPQEVVRALIEAANDAGGKDNVTAVYVEGEQFAARRARDWPDSLAERLLTPPDGRVREGDRPAPIEAPPASGGVAPSKAGRAVRVALILLIVLVGALALLVGTPTGRNLVRLELPRAGAADREQRPRRRWRIDRRGAS